MSGAEAAGKLEWRARAVFGGLLAASALAAIFAGPYVFTALVAVLASACAREWHRMVGGSRYALPVAATIAAICGALAWAVSSAGSLWPVWILVLGSLAAALLASASKASALWNAAGTLYVGVPALCLVALRTLAPDGIAAVLVLFLAVWMADTGALAGGRLVGGPKLSPRLSPKKTWAGFAIGTVLSMVAVALYIGVHGGRVWQALLLGLGLALAGHAGDLFESWVKRRVGRKNSGGLIPGHGGVLDRLDSTLFAAPLAGLLVFVFGLDPLCGGHP
ncbi:MAG TPA: phosphatidate cytidylyltransferase [Rhizomicrobium sp.]|jgi:phosphatidate cytidylyltransferase|nr:phosphatidate cytidylyltransferase [Rhizomicrobium sp.]